MKAASRPASQKRQSSRASPSNLDAMPGRSIDDVLEFLEGRSYRDFPDELLDDPGCPVIATEEGKYVVRETRGGHPTTEDVVRWASGNVRGFAAWFDRPVGKGLGKGGSVTIRAKPALDTIPERTTLDEVLEFLAGRSYWDFPDELLEEPIECPVIATEEGKYVVRETRGEHPTTEDVVRWASGNVRGFAAWFGTRSVAPKRRNNRDDDLRPSSKMPRLEDQMESMLIG